MSQYLFFFFVFIALTTKLGCSGEIPNFRVSYPLNDCNLYIFPFKMSLSDTTLHDQRTSVRSGTDVE